MAGLTSRWKAVVAVTATALAPLGLTFTGAEAGPAAPSPGCATGDAPVAARALYGPGTHVAGTARIAALSTALVMAPGVEPGVRHRMVQAGEQWCDATSAFNTAWRANGRSVGDGRAIAEAYSRLAAAPYFDRVTVTRSAGAVGAWTISTHALTNGVDAKWSVVTDASGIASARWVATAFAQEPFVASWEGLTALPNASESYTRLSSGLIDDTRGVPTTEGVAAGTAEDGEPGLSSHTFDDGFTITVSVGDTQAGVDPGVDTGIDRVDIVRRTLDAAKLNYHEFRSWGFTKGWEAPAPLDSDTGYIYINDALSLYCLACVLTGDNFNIHIISEVQTALSALGYDGYRDATQAYQLIIGHEMFHNFQNRYIKPGVLPDNLNGERFTHDSYSEGVARFQETLHDYAGTTFAADTLETATDANGCNGFDDEGTMDGAMATGPFGPAKTYNACFFWGPWYAAYGKSAFVKLVTEGLPAYAEREDGYPEIGPALADASGVPVADQLATFAASVITGQNRTWATWSGSATYDWGSLIERWQPADLGVGSTATRYLGGGGLMGHRIIGPTRVTMTAGADERLFTITQTGDKVVVTPAGADYVTVRPKPGQQVYVVAARPAAGSGAVTLTAAKPAGPPPSGDPVVGPAQAPVTGTVTTLAPGQGERIADVTSQYLEFTVPEGVDNASSSLQASYPLPADIDLYLQWFDGTGWQDIASGTSSALDSESLTGGRLGPGRYRIEVHNWAGPPGNQVSLSMTFSNSAGAPGV